MSSKLGILRCPTQLMWNLFTLFIALFIHSQQNCIFTATKYLIAEIANFNNAMFRSSQPSGCHSCAFRIVLTEVISYQAFAWSRPRQLPCFSSHSMFIYHRSNRLCMDMSQLLTTSLNLKTRTLVCTGRCNDWKVKCFLKRLPDFVV